ncbi:MAG TPA: MBL fold metallo-hydrolase [Vicinamibacterales bacterium]|nr:MBL fold metallo-hydrolase [Vicinamibacterales bacterium]
MHQHTPPRSRVFELGVVAAAVAWGAFLATTSGSAQGTAAPRKDPSVLRTMHVQGNVHVMLGAGSNITVQVGNLGAILVDTGTAANADSVLASLRQLTNRQVRYIINTHSHPDHAGGNERVGAFGLPLSGRGVAQVGTGTAPRAEIIAHEETLNRMSGPAGSQAPYPVAAWPTATFSGTHKEFFYNGEGVQLVHVPSAHTDGDSVVFFRRSDVIAAGDVYSTVSYPVIDVQRGGNISGVLDGLNQLLALVISGEKTEGGTMIVPGHGRISDEADLVEYRDMVTIIRDRVQDMVKRGLTVAQVKAANPTMEYDGLYGSAPGWSKDQFVEAVYNSLKPSGPASTR